MLRFDDFFIGTVYNGVIVRPMSYGVLWAETGAPERANKQWVSLALVSQFQ